MSDLESEARHGHSADWQAGELEEARLVGRLPTAGEDVGQKLGTKRLRSPGRKEARAVERSQDASLLDLLDGVDDRGRCDRRAGSLGLVTKGRAAS